MTQVNSKLQKHEVSVHYTVSTKDGSMWAYNANFMGDGDGKVARTVDCTTNAERAYQYQKESNARLVAEHIDGTVRRHTIIRTAVETVEENV